MKALVWHGKNLVRPGEVDRPECREGEAIIAVKNAGICGSDLTIYEGKHTRAKAPLIMGHEFSGVIVERKGDDRPDLKVGDRVTVEPTFYCGVCELCRSGNYHICAKKGLYGIDVDGAFAEFVRVSLKSIYKLPQGASFEEGAMVEPLAVAVRSIGLSRLMIGEFVAVLGAGPIGLLTAQVARAAGAAKVVVVEPVEFRRKMAEGLGFPAVNAEGATLENILKTTGGHEIDIVFDAAGAAPAALLETQLVRRAGRIVLVALYKNPVPYDLRIIAFTELQVIGVCVYTSKDFSKAVSLLEGGKIQLAPLVTHRYPVEEGVEAFQTLTKGGNAQKVLLSVS